jgi:signal transduction histidine kinase
MSSLPRFLALSLILLLTLLMAALGAQAWLRHQERHVLAAADHRLVGQLQAAVALTGSASDQWSSERLDTVSALTGVTIQRVTEAPAATPPKVVVPIDDGAWLVAESTPASGARLLLLSQRVLLALGVLTLALLVTLVGALATRRPAVDTGSRQPFTSQQRDVLSLAQLAKTSVSQQAALDHERDERLRAEGEARLRLQLLNRALEEKIAIGRDLHDGVIQSLYASGLTLQSAQALTARDPEEAARRIESTVGLINRTIAEIRAYIGGLSPLSVRGNSIARALEDVVEELRAGREVGSAFEVDENAAARLSDDQITHTLQIMREAVSNALRHGSPSQLQIALRHESDTVVLRVGDDGQGFDVAHTLNTGGHGLANMRARAERSGGRLTIESSASGTLLELHWPTAQTV